jgi:hypothetical protein
MARLTKAAITGHRSWLSSWHSPDEVAAYVEAVGDAVGPANFLSQPGTQFLRDAWAAAQFGRHQCSDQVRLVPEAEQWPDFEVRANGWAEKFECVEADLPGRRRGDEYRAAERRAAAGESTVVHDPVEDWHLRAEQALPAVSAAVNLKLAKNYARGASLLVHLNIDEWGVQQNKIEAGLAAAVAPGLPHFVAVWVLWKARLYGPWKSG